MLFFYYLFIKNIYNPYTYTIVNNNYTMNITEAVWVYCFWCTAPPIYFRRVGGYWSFQGVIHSKLWIKIFYIKSLLFRQTYLCTLRPTAKNHDNDSEIILINRTKHTTYNLILILLYNVFEMIFVIIIIVDLLIENCGLSYGYIFICYLEVVVGVGGCVYYIVLMSCTTKYNTNLNI